jgi:hypothetical protein
MAPTLIRLTAASLALAAALLAVPFNLSAAEEPTLAEILERLQRLEKAQAEQQRALEQRDQRIAELEAQLQDVHSSAPVAPVVAQEPAPAQARAVAGTVAKEEPLPDFDEPDYFGEFQPGGRGFKLANTPYGDLSFSLWSFARYLNQNGLESTYTDSFGRTRTLDRRNDLQLQKATLYFKGWIGDPRLRYLAYVWSANTSQGQSAQVVVAGNLTYAFQESFNLGVGISGLPSTRSTEGNWPNWLRVDNRTIADEYFRGSFTTGVFAFGNINEQWRYQAMLGNNLSQLGVDAGQLDGTLDTFSGALVWTPLGPFNNGFGDFEQSAELGFRAGLHYTHSTEDRQGQAGTDDPENSQIRLSDGTLLFQDDPFTTGGSIERARYQMVSLDAAVKLNGYALEGEYYYRKVDQFESVGLIPVSELEDHGFQLQASAMLVPRVWQLYLSGSKIFGEYGDPWDAALGLNWFPYETRQFRLNAELLYLERSPVGYFSVPYIVGGDGTVFYANAEYRF